MKLKFQILLFLLVSTTFVSRGQNVGLKSNLISDGFANVNVGIEVALSQKWSLDITGDYNSWDVNRHKWKHWAAQPELRLWLCDTFDGSFFGFHVLGGQYNFGNIKNKVKFLGSDFEGLTDYRYEGWAIGAGFAYGYSWILGKHWNLEAEIGIGWLYTKYSKYKCEECGTAVEKDQPHNYFGPTKLALNLIYAF